MTRSQVLASALLVTLLAAGLRFHRLGYQSYWNDEGNTRVLAGRGVSAIVQSAAADIHPPGYYLLLSLWRAGVGESEVALRGFSALAGVVLVPLLYTLGREYFNRGAGLAAALLGAVNPFLIYYSQEARMYALAATLGAASFLLFSRWLRSSRPPAAPWGDLRLAAGCILITALGLYTHYAFAFVVIAQNLAALGGLLAHAPRFAPSPDRKSTIRGGGWGVGCAWLGLQAVTLVLFLPWLPTAYRQLTAWPAARTFPGLLNSLLDTVRYLAFGRTVETGLVAPELAAMALAALLGLAGGQSITPLLWLLVPAGLTVGFGLLNEAFSKFLLVAVPPLCLLAGSGLARPPGRGAGGLSAPRRGPAWLRRLLSLALGAALLYGTWLSLDNLYFNPAYFRDDYRGIAAYLRQVQRPGDAVITLAPNQIEAFGYYHHPERGDAPVYPLPRARPLDPAATEAELQAITRQHDRLFVLFWGESQADPAGFIEGWLNANAFKGGDAWHGQVRLATYAAARPAAEPAVLSGARFGEHILLEGYSLVSASLAPGDILQLTLFWQADAPLPERYKVFVHVYASPDEPPVAQHDSEPGGGSSPTSVWLPGQRVADNHGVLLPADLPPGVYTLVTGLYNPVDSARLPVTLEGTSNRDSLQLAEIHIR